MNVVKKIFSSNNSKDQEKAQETAVRELCRNAGLHRIGDFIPEDVFIAGYPKSGNTWLQYLLSAAVFGVDLEFAPDSLVQDLVPDVHFKQFFRRYLAGAFFKTHALPEQNYRKVIYLMRDGRDAMVSYFHYQQNRQGKPIDFMRMVQQGEGLFPCKWHEHVEKWAANPYGAEMITVRYEDLKKDTVKELQRICEFSGLKRDVAVLERAAAKSSFASMKERQKTVAWENPRVPKDKFVRRGEVGSHKDEMPPDVREAFLSEAGAVLRKTGYLA